MISHRIITGSSLSGRTIFTRILFFFPVVVSFGRKHIPRSLEIQSNGNQNTKHSSSFVTIL